MAFKKLGLLILGVCLLVVGFTQNSKEFYQYKTLYPNENAVGIKRENTLYIGLKNNELIITETRHSETIYLDQTAKYQSKDKVYLSEFITLEKVEASSFNYINNKYKEFKVTDFKEKDETSGGSFYDGVKSINFYYSGLETGSKTRLSHTKKVKDPRFLRSYFFGDYSPIENYKVKIIADKNVALEFKMMNADSLDISFVKTKKGNKNIYEWELKKIKSYPNRSNAVDYRYTIPHMIPIINYYHINNDTTFVLSSIKDLYNWYQTLTSSVNQETCDKDLKALVDSITLPCTTDFEKVKNIYYWTQKNIKYIAFEDGLGGFIPRDANEVFQKKYGDCKDNSSILKQMLSEAGIKGYLTWIGTRDIPYKYEKVYSPAVDNHMILTYFDNEKPYFLDATGRFQTMEIPTSFIQGKEALVEVDKDNFKIITVPVVSNEVNRISDSLEIYLEEEIVKGRGKISYAGYEKINLFKHIEQISNKEDYRVYFNKRLEIGNNNFLLDEMDEINKFDYDKKFGVNYSFSLRNYFNKIDSNIYINLNLNQKDIESIKITTPYKTPVDYKYRFTGTYHTKFKIPENYEVEFLPENFEVKNDLCAISINYSVDKDIINYSHLVKTDFLMLSIDQQKKIQEAVESVQKNYKEVVVLKLKNS